MLPKDRHGYGYVSGMFDGHIYLIDPVAGTGVEAFDCETVTPHVDTPVTGGMGQILATPQSGDRLIFGLFQAGQVGMLDTTDRANLKQLSVVSFGKDTGPHNLVLSSDDNRLVVSDYFLNEDARASFTLKATTRSTSSKSLTIPSPRTRGLNSTSTRPSPPARRVPTGSR